jgi:hypothetical protein
LKQIETTKLFYGEYAYRLGVRTSLSRIFRDKNFNFAKRKLDEWANEIKQGIQPFVSPYNKHSPLAISEINFGFRLLNEFQKAPSKYTYRIEQGTINIFSNNKPWLKEIQSHFKDRIESFAEPKTEEHCSLLLSKKKVEITNKKNFKYKVYLRWTGKTYPNFGTWCERNKKLVELTPTLYRSLKEPNTDINGRYFYVSDDYTLTIVNLFISDAIRSVSELAHKNDFN